MKLAERWRNIAILGAAGKMGSGIALLLLRELAIDIAKGIIKMSSLTLIDVNSEAFEGLFTYLREHLTKFAEHNINDLRKWYFKRPNLIDNSEMIQTFVQEALAYVRCGSFIENCRDAALVFEAINEDIDIKSAVLQKANTILNPDTYFLTNTSSIPISLLQEKSGLEGRLIGFHFYSPPVVQKVIEMIIPENLEDSLHATALDIAQHLKKIVVLSHDIAGFIGNGHFIREIHAACRKVRQLQQQSMTQIQALFTINCITQEFLLRPMGIFQLIDYVGIDLADQIATIMGKFLSDGPFTDPLIQQMLKEGIKGGQYPNGKQKDGFFHYEEGHITAIYDFKSKSYVSSSSNEQWRVTCDKKIGELPQGWGSWKVLSKDSDKKEKIAKYFIHLWQQQTFGSEIAQAFLIQSSRLAHYLVDTGVADSIADVNAILQEGFYHLYAVDEPFMAVQVAGEKG